jgi:hypothetical protein
MQITPSGNQAINRMFYEAPDRSHKNRENRGESLSAALTELELHSEVIDFSVESENAQIQGHIERGSLDASFRYDDKIVNLHIEVERQVFYFASSQSPEKFRNELLDSIPEEAREKIEGYLDAGNFADALSPERVSENILDFALTNYNNFLNGQEDQPSFREKYMDIIKPAVERGFDEALEVMDAFLSDELKDLILETRNLTQDKLANFVGFDISA